jgi:hypothetical protein
VGEAEDEITSMRRARWGETFGDVQDQISKLPVEILDQLNATGTIEERLRRLEHVDTDIVTTLAGEPSNGTPV